MTGAAKTPLGPHGYPWFWLGLATFCVLVIAGTGCRVMAPGREARDKIHSPQDVAVNTEQARLRMRALVEPLSGAIVDSADRIIAGTTNRAVHRAALLWKIEAVPALREALFRPNPFVAAMDAWVLALQMGDYFERGQGRQALGGAAPVALTTCQYLENELMRVAASFTRSGDVTDLRTFGRKWAADHPIRHSIASRESTLSRATERELQETFSTSEVVGNINVTLDDLGRRIDIYSAQLLEQSRWHAELLALDLAADYQLDQAMPLMQDAVQAAAMAAEAVNRLASPLEKALAVVETTPDIVAKERAATFNALHEEVSRAIQFGQQERIAILQQLTKEREAALRELHRNIAEERKLLTADMERISLQVVDHNILRIAQLTGVTLIAIFVAIVLLLFITRRLFSGRRIAD